jgi:hypothetical protein
LCPNKIGCKKSFESQQKLIEHLKPEVFNPESLESFVRPNARYQKCLRCTSHVPRFFSEMFREGMKLQMSLTSSNHGLASCIAEMAASGDLEIQRVCNGCPATVFSFRPNWKPLHTTVTNGLPKVVEFVLPNGAEMNLQSSARSTSLHTVARAGKENLVKLLLDKGAIVNARDEGSHVAIRAASAEGHKHIVELWISRGGDIDGDAPQLARYRLEDLVNLLLSSGAKIKVRSEDYEALLRLAASESSSS